MKIGEWVYKNIKYNLSYSGRHKLTALDIYNKRAGVCHHYARLSNALLYSLGYPVAYILGYIVRDNIFEWETCHAWSIIKLGNKWDPFDSCWGLFKGKVPITHIFSNIGLESLFTYDYNSSDYSVNISFDQKVLGKFMEE